MKKTLFLLLFLTFFIAVNLYSQPLWLLTGNVNQPGLIPSISMCNSNVGWIVGGTGSPKIFKTTNGGVNWTTISTTGITQELYCVAGFDENVAFVGEGVVNGNARLFKTTNGGANWTVVLTTSGNGGFFNGIQFTRANNNLYGVAIAEKIYRSSNSGQTWVELNPGVNGVSNAHNSLMIIDNDFYGFGLNNGAARIRMTSDNSISWNTYQINISGNVTSAIAFHTNKLLGLAATSSSLPMVSRTTDGGLTWTSVNVGSGITGTCIVNWIPQSPVIYIMGENGGIKRSTDSGLTWVAMSTSGVTNLKHFDFFRSSNVVYGYAISSSGSVIKLVDTLAVLTGITSNNNIPNEFSLNQNYPNPFNPVTGIEYSVSRESFVKLFVYDALGREINVPVNETQKPGKYSVKFDGSNLNSGVYFYKLNAGEFSETRKMILLK
ncbi:MAG TPA: T9SS type A sorting domain-containing protein [Ignavibacteria bacterium]|nr:T9SS type A sorting domain-containing protein [Ignavibacteria bacterium]